MYAQKFIIDDGWKWKIIKEIHDGVVDFLVVFGEA